MYKYSVLILLFFTTSMMAVCQEQESILSAPDNWKSEQFTFPIGFAPSIDLVGFEDLRFAPGWSDTSSVEVWTYMFVWYIDKDSPMTVNSLSALSGKYFDGLMGVGSTDDNGTNQPNKTKSVFTKTSDGFNGAIVLHDAFFTKKEMTLYVRVKETFCNQSNKQLVKFELSQRDLDHDVWKIFEDVKVLVKCE